MKKLVLLLMTCAVSLSVHAGADVTIPKNRVVCESQGAMKTFLVRKKASNKVAKIPSDCRKIDTKRRGEVKQRYKGFIKVKTRLGDTFYVDKDAVRF